MIIYGELLVAENMIIGGVLLYITAMIHGKAVAAAGERLRLLAGSAMCGAFSMVLFVDVNAPMLLLMEGIFAVAVCTVSFGRRRWRMAVTFMLVTYFMGGVTMALLLATDNTGIYTAAGIYTGDMKAAMLAVFLLLGYITALQIIRTVRRKKLYTEHSCRARIVFGDETFQVRAFFDTGNRLKEPITGKPVAVASETLWKRLQSCGLVPEEQGTAKEDDGRPLFRFAMIPYETVGAKGMLEAVRADYIEIGAHRIRGCFVAGSDGSFAMEGRPWAEDEYDLLISAEMTGREI